MARKDFHTVDNGYRVPKSYFGHGYFIEKYDDFYRVYSIDECEVNYDYRLDRLSFDSYGVNPIKADMTLEEAKNWCMENSRLF